MPKRFMAIWFRYLRTDWFARRRPVLREMPFVLSAPDHGRMVVTAANVLAQGRGVDTGMSVADARVMIPGLEVLDDQPERSAKLLKGIAEWCIRYSPAVATDPPEGLMLDITGCAHLWGGERPYLAEILLRLNHFGYNTRGAIADTIGSAWAIARFGQDTHIIETGQQSTALLLLPPPALRLEVPMAERLEKLGLRQVSDFINMPRAALRRRFGYQLLLRLDQALGYEQEMIQPVQPIEPYQERLPCLEPIVTATGIEIALQRLLDSLCHRLQAEEKGLRMALFKCYRTDGKIEQISIGTTRASHNTRHLFKLLEINIPSIEPAPGIELFILEASKVEPLSPMQEKLWEHTSGLDKIGLSELLDRIGGKIGGDSIHRYLPDEHYWPERSFKPALSVTETAEPGWKNDRLRPVQLLARPELVEVTAPVPDYPPMLFRYKGTLHKIVRADGPERVEPEWWLHQGEHRDYYCVEDDEGKRYWLFRSGHYDAAKRDQWFIHGFFA